MTLNEAINYLTKKGYNINESAYDDKIYDDSIDDFNTINADTAEQNQKDLDKFNDLEQFTDIVLFDYKNTLSKLKSIADDPDFIYLTDEVKSEIEQILNK